jgi:hypothetical protein
MPINTYRLVPEVPTEEQWGGLARDIMMWMDFDCKKTPATLLQHLERLGTPIPDWFEQEKELKNLDHVISKGTRVALIYRAMLYDAPSPILSDPSIWYS